MHQKFSYIRSEPLMKAYRLIPCQNCGRDDGTVCGAHSNQAIHGKGGAIKASDIYCASLCSVCHYILDQGKTLTQEQRKLMWNRAHKRTVEQLLFHGYYPQSVISLLHQPLDGLDVCRESILLLLNIRQQVPLLLPGH